MITLPHSQTNKEVSDALREGATTKMCVKIRYRSEKNEFSERIIEPYEVKNGKLFGYCRNKGGIRSFKLENILAAVTTKKPYKGRYPVIITDKTFIK